MPDKIMSVFIAGLVACALLYTYHYFMDTPHVALPPAPVVVDDTPVAPTVPDAPPTPSMTEIMEKVCSLDSPRSEWTPSSSLTLNRKTALWWLNWYRESKDVKGVIMDAQLNREAERIADQIRQCPRAALDSPFSGTTIVRVGDRSLEGFVRAAIGDPQSEAIILRKDVRRVGAALLVDKNSHWISHWVIIFR